MPKNRTLHVESLEPRELMSITRVKSSIARRPQVSRRLLGRRSSQAGGQGTGELRRAETAN